MGYTVRACTQTQWVGSYYLCICVMHGRWLRDALNTGGGGSRKAPAGCPGLSVNKTPDGGGALEAVVIWWCTTLARPVVGGMPNTFEYRYASRAAICRRSEAQRHAAAPTQHTPVTLSATPSNTATLSTTLRATPSTRMHGCISRASVHETSARMHGGNVTSLGHEGCTPSLAGHPIVSDALATRSQTVCHEPGRRPASRIAPE
eukprot:1738841-Rhodomonas_salina.1